MTIKAWAIVASNQHLRVLQASAHGEKLQGVNLVTASNKCLKTRPRLTTTLNPTIRSITTISKNDINRTSKELVSELKKRAGREFDRLVVIAPPDFMGSFKKHANKSLDKYIYQTISKDISRNSHKEIEEYLEDDLFNSLTSAS